MGNSYLKVVFSYSKCSFQNAKFCLMEIFQRLTLNYLNKYSLLNKIANVVSVIFCHNLLKLRILVNLSSVVLSTAVSNLEKLCICASGCQTISGNASRKILISLICGTSLQCVTFIFAMHRYGFNITANDYDYIPACCNSIRKATCSQKLGKLIFCVSPRIHKVTKHISLRISYGYGVSL